MRRVAGSFRDPSGYVYESGGQVFRAVDARFGPQFEAFAASGLPGKLVDAGLLLPFEQLPEAAAGAWRTLKPAQLPFVSYPYEWSFGQLRDAALATLAIQRLALAHGMTLKDASAYNIQFWQGRPVLIDHLSFEPAVPGAPWAAYRQFVMHFLAPLALMAKRDLRWNLQLKNHLDGLPLDLASRALPRASWLDPRLFGHLHLHARLQQKYADTRSASVQEARTRIRDTRVASRTLLHLVDSLQAAVEGLRAPMPRTEWGDYYTDTNYSPEAFAFKQGVVERLAGRLRPTRACDLGANNGAFSRLLAKQASLVVSCDVDPVAVQRNYERVRAEGEQATVPVLQDLCNPSPGLGWGNEERAPFLERARCDLAVGLALVHHLCIGNNVPLGHVARLFRALAPAALLEFVPREDSQVQRLLAARPDIFPDYRIESAMGAFGAHYGSVERVDIPGTSRSLLLFTA